MSKTTRRYRYRTLREDYVEICRNNTVAALLLDYLASMDRMHDEARTQGERPTKWRAISGKWGGLVTVLQPPPSRETIRRALDILIDLDLVEEHPDNGKPAEPNITPPANRYRLISRNLIHMEREWAATSQEENSDIDEGGSVGVLGGLASRREGGSVTTPHESVKSEKEEGGVYAPAYEPPEVRAVRNDTTAHMNGWQLVAEYSDVTGIAAETIWHGGRVQKIAAGLAHAGMVPQDVREFMTEMKRTPDRYNGYRFAYLAEDLPRWKQQRVVNPAPRVLSDIERARREEEEEAERIRWRKEQGLL